MNMFARFHDNPAMTLQDIMETKRYGQTGAWMDAHTHGQRKINIPTTNKIWGRGGRAGYKNKCVSVNRSENFR